MPKQKNKQYSFKWNEKIYNNHHPFNLNDKNELCIDLRNNNFMLQFYHGLFVIVPIDVVNDYRPFPPPRVEYNKRTQSSSFKPFNCKFNNNIWLSYVIDRRYLYNENIKYKYLTYVSNFNELNLMSKNRLIWHHFDLTFNKVVVIISTNIFDKFSTTNINYETIPYFHNNIDYYVDLLPLHMMHLIYCYEYCNLYLKTLIDKIKDYDNDNNDNNILCDVLNIIDE